ncbi:unnamed protein product [Fusarium langsethiae]|nr:unnamed protein product [Fusarium langsethiae]
MTHRYIAVHKAANGPGDARPTADQIIKDENLKGKLNDHVIFITGCSAGIGVDTAKALYLTGATLYLTARNLDKAKTALGGLVQDDRVHLLELELESLDSVRTCATKFLSESPKLNILICNAGVMCTPEGRTKEGFETQFATNHLAHFLLFKLLIPALQQGVTTERAARVVMLSSLAHRFGEPDFNNINLEGCYDPNKAYSQSKTANLWTANEIERRYGVEGIHAWSVQPGGVLTDLGRHLSEEQKSGLAGDPYLNRVWKFSAQGAATTVWAATAEVLEGQGGKYLEDCQIIGKWDPSTSLYEPGYGDHAYDEDKAKTLWERSVEHNDLAHVIHIQPNDMPTLPGLLLPLFPYLCYRESTQTNIEYANPMASPLEMESVTAEPPQYDVLFKDQLQDFHGPLPTPNDIESGEQLPNRFGSANLVRIREIFIMKYGLEVRPTEAHNMLYVAKHTSVALPNVYAIYQRKKDHNIITYILMQHIPGKTLKDLWVELDK